MKLDDAKLKMDCMLRQAGLSKVSRPVLACIAVLCAALVALALWRFWPGGTGMQSEDFAVGQQSTAVQDGAAEDIASGTGTVAGDCISVDVEGSVRHPGLYTLEAGSRVGDAVEVAGGTTRRAARGAVNLAEALQDGQQVRIPSKREVRKNNAATENASAGAVGSTASSAGTGSGSGSGKININTASAQELQELSGIGEVTSANIIAYRQENGDFSSIEDIKNVSGIGDARFAAIQDLICV